MVRKMLRDDRGQGLVEYALIIALVALACIAAFRTMEQKTENSLTNSANQLS